MIGGPPACARAGTPPIATAQAVKHAITRAAGAVRRCLIGLNPAIMGNRISSALAGTLRRPSGGVNLPALTSSVGGAWAPQTREMRRQRGIHERFQRPETVSHK